MDYETLYGNQLLDDLHNHFPALLYDPSSFESVQDVLQYTQQQVRERFDLFSRGQREYRQRQNVVETPLPAVNTATTTQPNSTLPPTALRREDLDLTRMLTALLMTPMNRVQYYYTPTASEFLRPVTVRATPAQIQSNTTIGHVTETSPCAICQDNIVVADVARCLNSCGHWFHQTCIDPWFETNVHCPVCRHDVRDATRTRTPSLSSRTE